MTSKALGEPTEGKHPFSSTTFEWRRVRMRRPAEGHSERAPKAGRSYFRALSPWDWRRRPLTLRITYRGGAECWFEVAARGGTMRTPGTIALVDLAKYLANQEA